MSNLSKVTFRLASSANILKNVFGKRDFTRTLWHMCKNAETSRTASVLHVQKPSMACSCGCGGVKHLHTKGERELVEFLTEEILAERKSQKLKTIPSVWEGFAVKLNGGEVLLSKQTEKEAIVISFNVNHSVDSEPEPEMDMSSDKPDIGAMRAKPEFEVDIIKGNTTLSFGCNFLQDAQTAEQAEGEYNDVFGINELTVYEGEWKTENYAVSGELLDGVLYDLLMNLLDEKGINNDFVEKLSDLATAYEHMNYVVLLENLSKFTAAK